MHLELLHYSTDYFEHFYLLSGYRNLCTSRKTTIRFAVNPTTRMSQKQQQNKSGSVTTGSRCDGMEDKSHEKQAIGTRKHQESQHIQDCGQGEGDRLRFKVSVGMGEERSCE